MSEQKMRSKLLGRIARWNYGTHSKKEWRYREQRQWQKEALIDLMNKQR